MLTYCHYAVASDSALKTSEIGIKAHRSVTSHESYPAALLTSNTYKSVVVNSSAWPPACQRPSEMATFQRGHPATDTTVLLNQYELQ
jgi:hypothetical protein